MTRNPAKPGLSGRQAKPTQHAKRVMNNESFSPLIELGGRKVAEWIGSHPDAAIPKAVKLRVWDRCGGKCALTGRKIMTGEPWDLDHRIPLALGGRHAEDNLQVVSKEAHREKTRADVGDIAKVRRVKAKHLGIWPKPKRPLKSRGFEPSRRASFSSTNKG